MPAAQSPCASPAFHQFDFWIGNWSVYDWSTKKPAGHNLVTSEFNGCVVQEHWTGSEGSRGSSFNTYDPQRKLWHQTWVDDQGQLIVIEGNLVNGSMVLSGSGVGRNGRHFRQRITWTPEPGGDVRQHWEVSRDGGATWKSVFDGRYTKS
jgi:hypothetical protein